MIIYPNFPRDQPIAAPWKTPTIEEMNMSLRVNSTEKILNISKVWKSKNVKIKAPYHITVIAPFFKSFTFILSKLIIHNIVNAIPLINMKIGYGV